MKTIKTNVPNLKFGKIALWYAAIGTIYAVNTATLASIMVSTIDDNFFVLGWLTNMLTGSSWFLAFIIAFTQATIFLVTFSVIIVAFAFCGSKIYDKLDSATKATIKPAAKVLAIFISICALPWGAATAAVIYKAAALAKLGTLATTYVTTYSFIFGTTGGILLETTFLMAVTCMCTVIMILTGDALVTPKSTPPAATE